MKNPLEQPINKENTKEDLHMKDKERYFELAKKDPRSVLGDLAGRLGNEPYAKELMKMALYAALDCDDAGLVPKYILFFKDEEYAEDVLIKAAEKDPGAVLHYFSSSHPAAAITINLPFKNKVINCAKQNLIIERR